MGGWDEVSPAAGLRKWAAVWHSGFFGTWCYTVWEINVFCECNPWYTLGFAWNLESSSLNTCVVHKDDVSSISFHSWVLRVPHQSVSSSLSQLQPGFKVTPLLSSGRYRIMAGWGKKWTDINYYPSVNCQIVCFHSHLQHRVMEVNNSQFLLQCICCILVLLHSLRRIRQS